MKAKNNPITNTIQTSHSHFTAAVGNPPYQVSISGKNSDIWQYFITAVSRVTSVGSFIHPGRWVVPKPAMVTVQEDLISQGLTHFNYLTNDPFPGITLDGNVTITLYNFQQTPGKITHDVDCLPRGDWTASKKFFTNSLEEELYNKFSHLLEEGNMDSLRVGTLGAQSGRDFGYKKTEQVQYLTATPTNLKHPVKIWANKGYGKGSRFNWWWISKEHLLETSDYKLATTSRKVMLDKRGHAPRYPDHRANVYNNSAEIVGKTVIASEKVFLIPVEDTDRDLLLISSLLTTRVARALMAITQKDLYVRGLNNIPLYTTLARGLPNDQLFTDDWFFQSFNFSQDLQDYVQRLVSPKQFTNPFQQGGIQE